MNPTGSVLWIGGYGMVGQQVAQIIRQRHPHLPLLIDWRNLERLTIDPGESS